MTKGHLNNKTESGNAVVIALVAIVVVAIGALAVMSGKLNIKSTSSEDVVASADGSSETISIPPKQNPVIAMVDGAEIYREDAVEMMNMMPAQFRAIPPEQLFPIAVEQLVANKIVDKKAAEAKLENDKDVVEQLEKAKEQIIRTKFLENIADEALTDEALDTAYQKYLDTFQSVAEVNASHILVNDEKTAKDIISKLNKGADFAELAKEYSNDGTAQNGGELGFFAKSDVVPEFAEAAFALDAGQYSKTPVKSNFGFHVIKVSEKRDRPAAPFEQVKPMLEQDIRRQALDQAITEWKSDYTIERFDINGNPLNQAEPASGEGVEAPTEEAPAAEVDAEVETAPAE